MFDFANLLFSGPCNARCPFCIGRQIDPRLNIDNLDEFPPRNLDRFIEMIRDHGIRQVTFTGTNTDPLLYRYPGRLLNLLRARLPSGTQFSLHTNGRLALPRMEIIDQYDRVSISLPSFNPETYHRMMGVPGVPDLAEILRRACAPVKISCVVTDDNIPEITCFLEICRVIGIRRVVLRKLFGESRPRQALIPLERLALSRRGMYRHNPVYDFQGMEVTLWDFDQSTTNSINLFSTGVISTSYRLIDPKGLFEQLIT
jgi:MoaA/NifB/PqqE/SkfB family radical SAM enzyme